MKKIKKFIVWTLILATVVNFSFIGRILKVESAMAADDSYIKKYLLDGSETATNAYISQTKTSATIDLEFTQQVKVDLDIVDSSGTTIKHLYSSHGVTNPDPKQWNGKDGSENNVEDGVYTIKIELRDTTSNNVLQTDSSRTITVDRTKPSPLFVYDGENTGIDIDWWNQKDKISANWSFQDTTSGIDFYEYAIGTQSGGKYDWSVKPWTKTSDNKFSNITVSLNEGETYYVGVKAFDKAGNESEIKVSDGFTIDTISPTTTVSVSPSSPNGLNGWYKSAPTITFSAFDNTGGSGVEKTYYKWDSDAYREYSSIFSAPEGTHTLYYYSKDVAGNNENPNVWQVKVDTQLPYATALPLPSTINTSTFNIFYNASDETSGISYVELRFSYSPDGVNWVADRWFSDEIPYYSSPILFDTEKAKEIIKNKGFSGGGDGYYKFYVVAVDNAGNRQPDPTEAQARTYVDATIPSAPSGLSASVSDGYVTLSWQAVPDAEYYEIWRASSEFVLIAKVAANQTSYIDKTVTRGKSYQYKIIAVDKAGNRSQAAFVSITVPKLITIIPKAKAAPSTPSITAPPSEQIAPPAAAEEAKPQTTEKGKILGEEAKTEGRNWTPIIVIASLILLFITAYIGWVWYQKKTTTERW